MANEGKVIGDADHFGPSTWGALRSVIFNLSSPITDYVEAYPHNVHFKHGFKTTAGNGFIRTDYSALFGNAGTPQYGPNFNIQALSLTPPFTNNASFSSDYQASSHGMIVNEDRTQFVGETVSYTGGTLSITANAFLYPYYQVFSATVSPEPITSIGKLTAF